MSQKPIIEITHEWTDLGNGWMIRVRKPPLRVVPLSSLNCTTNRPKPRVSGWVHCSGKYA